jgi:Protein of unknown function (DUF3631)
MSPDSGIVTDTERLHVSHQLQKKPCKIRLVTDVTDVTVPTEGIGAAPADGAETYQGVRSFITRFVSLGEDEATAVALWVMATHALTSFDCIPYLAINSAEKQCGKTRLLEVMELLVARPWSTGRCTAAVLARKIDAECPTLLLDESDAAFGGNKEYTETLRGVLNTGYLRSGRVSLCVTNGKTIDYVDLSTFGPKAIAGIGKLPDTVADRSIPIRLTRKLAREKVERFRRGHVVAQALAIKSAIESWVIGFCRQAHPEPQGLDKLPDRAADIAEPLLQVAESFGGDLIASEARGAVAALCGRGREDESVGVRLLRDIKAIFDESQEDAMPSKTLAQRLSGIETSPWVGRNGKEFDGRDLARLLKPFDKKRGEPIKPHPIRLDKVVKGYERDDFTDAWERYLPTPSPENRLQRLQQLQPFKIEVFEEPGTVTEPLQKMSHRLQTRFRPAIKDGNAQVKPGHNIGGLSQLQSKSSAINLLRKDDRIADPTNGSATRIWTTQARCASPADILDSSHWSMAFRPAKTV